MTDSRKDIRPVIKGIDTILNKSDSEVFQNETLRPIIKLQHDLLVAYFTEYVITKKIKFDGLSHFKKQELISTAFKKDNAFKTELRGMIIGHFTTDEFALYNKNKSDFNKRILAIIQQRISSVIELF
jgi:hypothetical protein